MSQNCGPDILEAQRLRIQFAKLIDAGVVAHDGFAQREIFLDHSNKQLGMTIRAGLYLQLLSAAMEYGRLDSMTEVGGGGTPLIGRDDHVDYVVFGRGDLIRLPQHERLLTDQFADAYRIDWIAIKLEFIERTLGIQTGNSGDRPEFRAARQRGQAEANRQLPAPFRIPELLMGSSGKCVLRVERE